MPVACFLGRGRIHIRMNAPSMGVGMRILFVVVGYRNSIYSVHQTQKEIHPQGGGFLFARVRDLKIKSKLPVAALRIRIFSLNPRKGVAKKPELG